MKIFKCVLAAVAVLALANASRAEMRSFTITFGAQTSSTKALDNSDFLTAVKSGRSYIADVSGVVNAFPEVESVKLSSSKNNGSFELTLTPEASIIAEYYEIAAARYNNQRDADASLTLNGLNVAVTSTDFDTIRIEAGPDVQPQRVSSLAVSASKRLYLRSITVFYDSANGSVPEESAAASAPQFLPAGGAVAVGELISVWSATPDAEIRYTTDGSDPTEESTLYTAPFSLPKSTLVKACAYAAGLAPSPVTEASFTVTAPQADVVAHFDFGSPESLNPAVTTPAVKEWVDLDCRSFTDSGAAVCFHATGDGNTHVRLYNSYDAGCDLRLYDGETMTVATLDPAAQIKSIDFEVSLSGTYDISLISEPGEYDLVMRRWTPAENEITREVTFMSVTQSRIRSMSVQLARTTGVRELDYRTGDHAVYYNARGLRMSKRPEPGFYIRVTPEGASKVIIR